MCFFYRSFSQPRDKNNSDSEISKKGKSQLKNSETEKCVEDVAESEKSKPPINLRKISSYKIPNGNKNASENTPESSNSNSERTSTVSSEITVELTEDESAVLNQILNYGHSSTLLPATPIKAQKDKPVQDECDNKLETESNKSSTTEKQQPLSRNSSTCR